MATITNKTTSATSKVDSKFLAKSEMLKKLNNADMDLTKDTVLAEGEYKAIFVNITPPTDVTLKGHDDVVIDKIVTVTFKIGDDEFKRIEHIDLDNVYDKLTWRFDNLRNALATALNHTGPKTSAELNTHSGENIIVYSVKTPKGSRFWSFNAPVTAEAEAEESET